MGNSILSIESKIIVLCVHLCDGLSIGKCAAAGDIGLPPRSWDVFQSRYPTDILGHRSVRPSEDKRQPYFFKNFLHFTTIVHRGGEIGNKQQGVAEGRG